MTRCRYYGDHECIRREGHRGSCCPTVASFAGWHREVAMLRIGLAVNRRIDAVLVDTVLQGVIDRLGAERR